MLELDSVLRPTDRSWLSARGIDPSDVERQLEIFRASPPPIRLQRPCTVQDGIVRLQTTSPQLEALWRAAASTGRFLKFVPASGAATRMFGFLRDSETTGEANADLSNFFDKLESFPFLEQLERAARQRHGQSCRALWSERPEELIELLFSPAETALASLPKGLLPFHGYDGGAARTAFEEHLREGCVHLAAGDAPASFLFTVSPEHRDSFRKLFAELLPTLRAEFQRRFTSDFTVQAPATDTITVDLDNRPLRGEDGRFIFRPGGHGALLANLQRSQGDLVYLKNIDNIPRSEQQQENGLWKRLLGGYLIHLEQRIHALLDALEQGSGEPPTEVLDDAVELLHSAFALRLPDRYRTGPPTDRLPAIVERLNRPLRVCGVVVNRGEPGGGPFWVEHEDGTVSGQIVESSQVDRDDPAQRKIWSGSTHFNPVDLVCALRDRRGAPYDLAAYVDRRTYFVARKELDGRPVKALERPGLWNGAMAGWNTAFVEVPEATFSPVKTLLDLLRPAHQPPAGNRSV